MNKFTFSILYLSAKSDLSKSMNKAHSPSGLFVEWSWLKSSISDLWKSFGGKQGALFVFTPNQTKKSFLKKKFPTSWKLREIFHSDNSEHMKFPPGNNLTAGSSCSVESAFLVLSRLLISHLAVPSSCQGAPARTAALAPHASPAATPTHPSKLPTNPSFPQLSGSSQRRQNLPSLSALQQKVGKPWSFLGLS